MKRKTFGVLPSGNDEIGTMNDEREDVRVLPLFFVGAEMFSAPARVLED
jgi:hypothetical protein